MSLDISALSDRFTVRRLTQTFPPCMKLTRNNINTTPPRRRAKRSGQRTVLPKPEKCTTTIIPPVCRWSG